MEYYDGVAWKAIDSPPTISSISPSTFSASGDTITVSGSNFQTGVNITMTASDGTTYTPDSVTRVSSSEVTFDISSSIVADEADPWDVTVSNSSGLSVTSNDALTLAGTISANTSAGSLGTVYDSARSSLSYDLGVTTSESDVTFTYAVSSGSLSSGLSLNTSTGAVTGTADAVGSDTTSNFTITATGSDASDPDYAGTLATAYSLTIAAPVVTSYTSTGSGTFSVPSGVTSVDALVVAGGGGGAQRHGGGGGAGGLIYRPAFPVTPGGSVSYSVGRGGYGGQQPPYAPSAGGEKGYDSTFGVLTAKGGGASGGDGTPADCIGGSGGGGDARGGAVGAQTGNQPQQPGDSGTYGFGNPSGNSNNPGGPTLDLGAGGGGAGGAGGNNSPQNVGAGGAGKSYSISGSSITYAEGGSGASRETISGPQNPLGIAFGTDATANRGSGGHGSNGTNNADGGNGGSGIVIVKY
jgi:hypothetical protein